MALIIVTGIPGSGKSSLCKGNPDEPGSLGLKDILEHAVHYDKDYAGDLLMAPLNLPPEERFGEIYYKFVRTPTYGLVEYLALMDLKREPHTEDSIRKTLETSFQNSSGLSQLESLGQEHQEFIDTVAPAIAQKLKYGNGNIENVLIDATYSTDIYDEEKATELFRRWSSLSKKAGTKLVHLRCYAPPDMILDRIRRRNRVVDRWKIDDPDKFLEKEPIFANEATHPIYVNTSQDYASTLRQALSYISDR